MFNVGGGELIVIALIALIVLGPQRLPDAARQVGKVMGDLRKLSSGFQNEMKSAFVEADDPTRISARRNVLAKEAPVEPPADADDEATADVPTESADVDPAVSAAVAAVAAPPDLPPSAKATPPAGSKTTSVTQPASPTPVAEAVEAEGPEGSDLEASSEPVVPEAEPPRSTP